MHKSCRYDVTLDLRRSLDQQEVAGNQCSTCASHRTLESTSMTTSTTVSELERRPGSLMMVSYLEADLATEANSS